ncbi:MAG: hypothetical protein JWO12_2088 [Frankiales bacterium]|nr:hypothetical protein [Frankiales bacterium]
MTRSIRTRTRVGAVAGLLCLATACGSTVQVKGTALQSGSNDGLQGSGSSGQGTTGDGQQGSTTGGLGTPGGTSGGSGGAGSTGSGGVTPGGGTTGATSGGSGTSAGSTSGAVSQGSLPTTGPGWDAKNVYVGVPTADDFNAAVKNLGANFSNGDVHGDVDAIVADINKTGGLFGRKLVVAYHDTSTASLVSDPAGVSQSMCSYFTQDRPVVAVINGAPQLDAQEGFHTCLEKKQTTLLSLSNTEYSDKDYAKLGPHLFTVASLSTDILVPTFVAALNREKYFTGWDTTAGGPGKAAVRVGLLLEDSPAGRHVDALFRASLQKIGVTVATDFYYDPAGTGQKSQSEVLQFSAAKVTHVLDLPPVAAELYLFQNSAEQQHYRPRYGFTSFNLPLGTEENAAQAPPVQQVGSIGIGWQPFNDANASHDPGALPGTKRCFSALSKGGQTFNSSSRRAALIATQLCDSLYLLRDAIVAGRGFSGADLLRAMPVAGSRLATAATFNSGLVNDNHGVPGSYRGQQYQTACSCFTYTGGNHPFSR